MTFYPLTQLNFNSAFACGAFWGNSLRESLFSSKTATCPPITVDNGLYCNNWFSLPMLSVPSFNMSIFPLINYHIPSINENPFDFSFSNVNKKWGGLYYNFDNRFIQPFSFDYDFMHVGNSKKLRKTYATLNDYNATKGRKIANIAYENTGKRFDANWNCIGTKNRDAVIDHDCARHVALAIYSAGLGDIRVNSAYQMTEKLRQNSNFQELSVEETDWEHLPPGSICIYEPGGAHNYSDVHGHATIITENGNAAEHYSTNLTKPDYIFIPV